MENNDVLMNMSCGVSGSAEGGGGGSDYQCH